MQIFAITAGPGDRLDLLQDGTGLFPVRPPSVFRNNDFDGGGEADVIGARPEGSPAVAHLADRFAHAIERFAPTAHICARAKQATLKADSDEPPKEIGIRDVPEWPDLRNRTIDLVEFAFVIERLFAFRPS